MPSRRGGRGRGEDESSLYNILSKLALHPSPHCQFLVVLCEASIMMNDLYVFKNGDCKTFNLPRILKNCLMDCLDILVKNEVRRLYTEKELCNFLVGNICKIFILKKKESKCSKCLTPTCSLKSVTIQVGPSVISMCILQLQLAFELAFPIYNTQSLLIPIRGCCIL